MLHKQFDSRLVASLVAISFAGGTLPAGAEPTSTQSARCQAGTDISCQVNEGKLLIANHGCASPSVGAVDLLGTQPAGPGSEALTDSLWGNLILQMAYARDSQLGRGAKKLRLTDNLTLASIYGISGVSLAQSITSLATLNQNSGQGGGLPSIQQPEMVAEGGGAEAAGEAAHHHDTQSTAGKHSDHNDSVAPGVLGLIASGSTIVALGLRFYFGHRYSKQIKKRQQTIKARVEAILTRLEKGESPEQLHGELEPLIGERAAKEFGQLWRASHQVAAAGASG
ncbi:MAG: hypothetical protein IT342_02320 [Candidatus Melainabacteria bacterium]|nr:hypothetical protein [Candidatus Melainabacteria bacterium]